MKKLLILLLLLFIASFNKGWCGVAIQSTGATVIGANQVSTPIRVDIATLISLSLTMKVKCLDQYITNTSNSSYRIPISNVTDYINIKYTLKNTSGTYIPEGIYNNYGTYNIQQGN